MLAVKHSGICEYGGSKDKAKLQVFGMPSEEMNGPNWHVGFCAVKLWLRSTIPSVHKNLVLLFCEFGWFLVRHGGNQSTELEGEAESLPNTQLERCWAPYLHRLLSCYCKFEDSGYRLHLSLQPWPSTMQRAFIQEFKPYAVSELPETKNAARTQNRKLISGCPGKQSALNCSGPSHSLLGESSSYFANTQTHRRWVSAT